MKSTSNQITIEDYTLQELLGEGQYGKVYKGLNYKTNKLCAVKAVPIQKFKEVDKLLDFTMNEIQSLAQIENQHVIQFVEMMKTSHHYYFVYEYCNGGDLEHLEAKVGAIPEQQAIMIFKQILKGFTSLVKANIMHRDLKPANILFHNGQVKLADFGFCKQLNSRKDMTSTMVGSPIYMAPEILLGKEYTSSADIWSLGCVFYEMLYQQCPFEEKSISALIHAVETKEAEFPPRFNVTQQSIDILKPILVKDPAKRITWEELFQLHLSQQDLLTIQPSALLTQDTDKHIQRRNSEQPQNQQVGRTFQYIVHERNKLLFLFTTLQEMLELNFSVDVPIYSFVFVKYIAKVATHIKKNLIDQFNIAAFPHLANKFEQWNLLPESFEYRSFVKLNDGEIKNMIQMMQPFLDEFNKSLSFSKYRSDIDITKELQSDCTNMNLQLLKRYMINYVEEIKTKYLQQFVQQQEGSKKWLKHSQKIIDSLLIDDTFENFFNVEHKDFYTQKYFTTLEENTMFDLLNIVQNKVNYIRNYQFK